MQRNLIDFIWLRHANEYCKLGVFPFCVACPFLFFIKFFVFVATNYWKLYLSYWHWLYVCIYLIYMNMTSQHVRASYYLLSTYRWTDGWIRVRLSKQFLILFTYSYLSIRDDENGYLLICKWCHFHTVPVFIVYLLLSLMQWRVKLSKQSILLSPNELSKKDKKKKKQQNNTRTRWTHFSHTGEFIQFNSSSVGGRLRLFTGSCVLICASAYTIANICI